MADSTKGFFARTGEALGFTAPQQIESRAVDGPAAGVVPPAPSAWNGITVEQSLSIGAVYRCVSIISSSVSQMPLGVYRGGIEIDTPTLIKSPDVDLSQRQFIKQTMWSLATHGNAYWRVYGSPAANVVVLDPAVVSVTRVNGRVQYSIGGEDVPAASIKHLRLMAKPGDVKGYGPIQYGTNELVAALKVRTFADQWFGASGVPQGMLTTDAVLNADQAKAFADAWAKFVSEHGTAVLSQGMRYEYLNIKPADAQYLEVQQSHTVAISRLFGVPPTLLASGNEGSPNTYSNQQELFIQFLQTTLVDYMNEIEDALSSLLPRGQEVSFKEDSLLRMNTALETDVQVKQIAAGLRTPDELRAVAGLPPLPAGYTLPMTQSPNTNNGSEQNEPDA